MDWGDAAPFVSFGSVGAGQVDGSDVYLIIAPQNIVGASIFEDLRDMREGSCQCVAVPSASTLPRPSSPPCTSVSCTPWGPSIPSGAPSATPTAVTGRCTSASTCQGQR